MTNQTTKPPVEQVQKAALRRMDWRFLLPAAPAGSYRHLLLLGGPPALAPRLVESKLATQVSCESQAGDFDAAILLHKSAMNVEEVAMALEPGAALYWEVARTSLSTLRMTPQQLTRRLAAAGFALTGIYWAAPNFEQCRRYIPLDAPGAMQWYFHSLFVAGTPLHHLIRQLFQRFPGKKLHPLAWVAPCLSLTATYATRDVPPPSLLGDPRLASTLGSEPLRPLLLTSGQDDGSRVIMLPFTTRGSSSPQAVIKVATDPSFNPETAQEQQVLREVGARLDPELRQAIPEPLATLLYHGLAASVESCAPGHSLWVSSGAWGASSRAKMRDLELGAAWLTRFHGQTIVTRQRWDHRAVEQWVDEPITHYTRRRAASDAEKRMFTLMRERALDLRGSNLPLVWQHHDFAPWNLFRNGTQLTVIDWEFNRGWEKTRAGAPLCDLLYFVTYWNNLVHRHYQPQAELAGMRRLFLELSAGDPYEQRSRQVVTRYMAALEIEWRFLPLLLLYTWMERVIYSYARAEKLGHPPATSRAAEKFASYVGLLAGHAEKLFAAENDELWRKVASGVMHSDKKRAPRATSSGSL